MTPFEGLIRTCEGFVCLFFFFLLFRLRSEPVARNLLIHKGALAARRVESLLSNRCFNLSQPFFSLLSLPSYSQLPSQFHRHRPFHIPLLLIRLTEQKRKKQKRYGFIAATGQAKFVSFLFCVFLSLMSSSPGTNRRRSLNWNEDDHKLP